MQRPAEYPARINCRYSASLKYLMHTSQTISQKRFEISVLTTTKLFSSVTLSYNYIVISIQEN